MSNLKSSLTRKLGPLPAWAWALIAFVGIYYYRTRISAQASGTGTGSVGPTPTTPQPQTLLQPGESVYDPNTGALTTAPGGGSAGGSSDITGTSLDPNALAAAIAGALAQDGLLPGQNGTQGAPNTPDNTPAGTPAGTTSTGGARGKPKKPKLTAPGAMYAPSGHNRPAAKAGYTIKGLGRGFWEYVPKRKAKSKGQNNAKSTSKYIPQGATTRARSNSATRPHTGGRTTSRQKGGPTAVSPGSHRGGTALRGVAGGTPSRARQPTRTPPVRTVVRQRPVATHPAPAPSRQTGGVAPRPSAPPPRTQRAPARVAPRPPARRRK